MSPQPRGGGAISGAVANAPDLTMSKHSSTLRRESRPRKAAKPVEEAPLSAIVKYTEESPLMRLDEAMEYFSSGLPKEFYVSMGVYSRKGCEELAKGEGAK